MTRALFLAAVFAAVLTSGGFAQTITDITPPEQRVYDYIVIHGSGFGSSQGTSEVRFTAGTTTIEAGTAYVWRDDYIKIRVPIGNLVGGSITPIPKSALNVTVAVGGSVSPPRSFRVITQTSPSLSYEEITSIDPISEIDTSTGLLDSQLLVDDFSHGSYSL